jgi:hypothetical protein
LMIFAVRELRDWHPYGYFSKNIILTN